MSDVYFLDYSRGGSVLQGLKSLFHEANLTGVIPVDGSVAVKLHMGELGNITYLRPILVRRVVDLLRRAGGKPFVTDTTALYPGGRDTPQKYLATAATNGFLEQSVNAPIIIADGGDDLGVPVAVDGVEGCELTEVRVASRIYHADSLIVLTHFKGHMQTGFGGALKNMGMGCVVKETKKAQHRVNTPLLDESLCDGCGICIGSCPRGALWLEDDKPRRDLRMSQPCLLLWGGDEGTASGKYSSRLVGGASEIQWQVGIHKFRSGCDSPLRLRLPLGYAPGPRCGCAGIA